MPAFTHIFLNVPQGLEYGKQAEIICCIRGSEKKVPR